MSSNYPEQFPRTEVKSPHSNEPGVPDDIREVPKVEGLPPLTEDIIETTNKPNTPFEGFGGEKVELEADEKATFDQVRKSVAARYETAEAAPETEKKRLSLKTRIFAALTGVALLAGAGAGIKAMTDGASEPLHPEQTTSGTADPGQTETTAPAVGEATPSVSPSNVTPLETAAPTLDTLKTIGIEANQSDEAMAQDLIHTLSSWHMAGATPEAKAVRTSQYGHLTLEAYAEKIAAEQVVNYAPKLFGKDYASNALLLNTVNGYQESNKINILAFLQTSGTTNPGNKEAYTRSLVLDEVTNLPTAGADKSLSINYHEIDNSDKNNIGGGGISEVYGHKGNMTLSLNTVDGSMIITLIKYTEA
jgi:hypothetical protein